jgi:hypothetical protein
MGGAIGGYYQAMVLGIGNMALFGDAFSPTDAVVGAVLGGLTGGITNGISAVIHGKTFLRGAIKTPVSVKIELSGVTLARKDAGISVENNVKTPEIKPIVETPAHPQVSGGNSGGFHQPNNRVVIDIENPVNIANYKHGSRASWKSISADDLNHSFSRIVDNYAGSGSSFTVKGGDGILRQLYQVEGSLHGVSGRFEWMLEAGKITHRQFVPGGTINGIPIKR